MTIDAGDVGIGTASPDYRLEVVGSTDITSEPVTYVKQTGAGRGLMGDTQQNGACALAVEAGNHGLRVIDAGLNSPTSGSGVWVDDASWDGIHVANAGFRAGYFGGSVTVVGFLTKLGGGFLIDHPLDPANKYLQHSFVESPEMKNVYDGVVTLDQDGQGWVELPDWFEALNEDFRYQLTAMGAPAPNLHVAHKIQHHRFKVAGGEPGMEVSWQVTGIRKDPWAQANRGPAEFEKPDSEKGYYLTPELYGLPTELSVENAPRKLEGLQSAQE
jgi:hypothetical protein